MASDTCLAILKILLIEATTATRPNDLEGSISLGTKGTVVIGGYAVSK